MVKDFACNAEVGSIPRLAVSPEGKNGNILQYSYLENHMDRGAWRAAVNKVAKGQTRLEVTHPREPRVWTHSLSPSVQSVLR